jgi:K+-transporting ATPase ATPase C chain
MLAQLRAALVSLVLFHVLTGIAYPLLVTGIARAAFPSQASGSIVYKDGHPIGSRLIGQSFDGPTCGDARSPRACGQYFWSRLSATTDANGKPLPYRADSSVGSNLGPTNPALTDEAKGRIDLLGSASAAKVPVDLVTSSASGLDPDISPAAAYYQVPRIAKARGLGEDRLRQLVAQHIEGRQVGILGEPRVNVLELNLALDEMR